MKPIDFDQLLYEYACEKLGLTPKARLREAGDAPKNAMDEPLFEEHLDELDKLYDEWAKAPAEALDGVSPAEWFTRFQTPVELTLLMLAYVQEDCVVPDLLLDRLIGMGKPAETALAALLQGNGMTRHQSLEGADFRRGEDARILVLNLLQEMESKAAVTPCVDFLRVQEGESRLCAVAISYLCFTGAIVLSRVFDALEEGATEFGQLCLCTVLAEFPEDGPVFSTVLSAFEEAPDGQFKAEYAYLLERIGDESALPALREALGQTGRYISFLAIRSAMEAMGEFVDLEPDFSGDPDYERIGRGDDD